MIYCLHSPLNIKFCNFGARNISYLYIFNNIIYLNKKALSMKAYFINSE